MWLQRVHPCTYPSQRSFLASIFQELFLIKYHFLQLLRNFAALEIFSPNPVLGFVGRFFCFHQRVFFANGFLSVLRMSTSITPSLTLHLYLSYSSLSRSESPCLPILFIPFFPAFFISVMSKSLMSG